MRTFRFVPSKIVAAPLLLITCILLPVTNGYTIDLSKSKVTKVAGKKLCGLLKNKWKPIERIANRKGEYNQISGTKAHRQACSALLSSRSVKSLSDLPSVSEVARASASEPLTSQTVSGTPPPLKEIPEVGAKDVFWTTGLVDRLVASTPTQDDCNQFFGSTVDGESGGLAACFMTQNVGYSFQHLLQSGTSLCYMKGISDATLGEDGGVTVVEGSPPGNTISRVFSPGTGGDRLVNVAVSGFPNEGPPEENSTLDEGTMDIFIRVASQSKNARNGNQYEVDLFHCNPDSGTVDEYENIQIRTNGQYLSKARYRDDGVAFIRGWLTRNGTALVFDPSKEREITFVSLGQDSGFGSNVVFTSENTIKTKHFDRSQENEARRSYSVSSFSGSSMNDLRFLAGAYQDEKEGSPGEGFNACVEYRDTFYAASPDSALCAEAQEVSLEQDEFFTTLEEQVVEVPEFDCANVQPDILISMDFTKSSTGALAEECEAGHLNNMDFCRSDDVSNAENNFLAQCI